MRPPLNAPQAVSNPGVSIFSSSTSGRGPRVASEKEDVTAPDDLTQLPISSLPTGSVAPPALRPDTQARATPEAPANPSTLPAADAVNAKLNDANPGRSLVGPRNTSSTVTERPAAAASDVGSPPHPVNGAGSANTAPDSGVGEAARKPTAAGEASKLRPCERKDALGTSGAVVVNAPEGGLHIGLES